METNGVVKQDVAGVTRVDIINRRETVRFTSMERGRARSNPVRVNGVFQHPVHGMSRSQSTLYLIAFEGSLSLPDGVAVSYKRGVGDLQKELIDAYAPSLSYGKMLETQKIVRSLEAYQDVPPTVILDLTHRFADATTQGFFASQAEVGAPPNLERIERKVRAQSFRWNGAYSFLQKAQAGQYTVIPELAGAHTPDELWNKILEFLVKKVSLKDAALAALVAELSQLTITEVPKLLELVLELQPVMARTEAHGEALATTAMKSAEGDLLEGLEALRKKKIPYGATLAKHFGALAGPISQQLWLPVMAEVGAREAETNAKARGPKTPGSTKTAKGQAGIRDATNWEAALNDKKTFSVCLTATAVMKLRSETGAWEQYGRATQQQVREWLPELQDWKTQAANLFHLRRGDDESVEFTPDKKSNQVRIRFTGEKCDRQFASGSPTPSPSPSASPSPEAPTGPPTEKTRDSYNEFSIWKPWTWF